MPSVTNLQIQLQSGSTNTYYATWNFNEDAQSTTSTSEYLQVGSLVSIKPGANWANGTEPQAWVRELNWYVAEIRRDSVAGDKALLWDSEDKTHTVKTWIFTKDIVIIVAGTGGDGTSSTEPAAFSEETLDHYSVKWEYDTGDNVWFAGNEMATTIKNATYSPPSNVIKIKVTVKPVAKKHKVNNTETEYWTGTDENAEYTVASDPPNIPETPSVMMDDYQLTCKIDNISDPKADSIEFAIYSGDTLYNSGVVDVVTCRAIYVLTVAAGKDYRVRARAINHISDSLLYSEWSAFTTDDILTKPTVVESIVCRAVDRTNVELTWDEVPNADAYTIEYSVNSSYFDSSDATQTVDGIETLRYLFTGLQQGQVYYFRMRSVNDSGESEWSEIVSLELGTVPVPPSTWSSTTTAIVGEMVTLFWQHNSRDNSTQKAAQILLTINGESETIDIDTSEEPDDEKTMLYTIPDSKISVGANIEWSVRTKGVMDEYSDWSIVRQINVYVEPTLSTRITDQNDVDETTIEALPFYIKCTTSPASQYPIAYYINIISMNTYNSIDNYGRNIIINAGDSVYEKTLDTTEQLIHEISGHNVTLKNGINYSVNVEVLMNSGLTAYDTKVISIDWLDGMFEPNATIGVNRDSLYAYIMPFCKDDDGYTVENISLSVYRREFDGRFTEIAKNLVNGENAYVIDPHPSLDYARYRIVARSTVTGNASYYDAPAFPVNEKSIVIQWDEAWTNFNAFENHIFAQNPWGGSMLKLKYNIRINESSSKDVSFVDYIGRSSPVTYYGTKIEQSGSWSTDIPKTDAETVYQLRRLNSWLGNAYVREPSGVGYWANVSISFSRSYNELVIPVVINVTKVEGGI